MADFYGPELIRHKIIKFEIDARFKRHADDVPAGRRGLAKGGISGLFWFCCFKQSGDIMLYHIAVIVTVLRNGVKINTDLHRQVCSLELELFACDFIDVVGDGKGGGRGGGWGVKNVNGVIVRLNYEIVNRLSVCADGLRPDA